MSSATFMSLMWSVCAPPCRLTELPGTLGALPNLQALSVAHNGLTSLPDGLGRLSSLQRLDVRGNRLNSLPAALAGCAALTELDAVQNCLCSLPDALGGLTNLRALLLDDNRCAPACMTVNVCLRQVYQVMGMSRNFGASQGHPRLAGVAHIMFQL